MFDNIAYQKEYYQNNKSYFIAKNKRIKKRIRTFIRAQMLGKSCTKCGEDDVRCLDFHHTRGKKSFSLGSAGVRSEKSVLAEIAKCVIICSNCHRKIHCPLV